MAFFNFNRIRLWWIAVTLPLLLVLLSADVQADTEQARVKLGPWVEQLEVGPKMNAAGKCLRDSGKTTVPGTESGIRASEFTSGMPQPDDAGARPQRTPPSV
jgi:hypothetical protein